MLPRETVQLCSSSRNYFFIKDRGQLCWPSYSTDLKNTFSMKREDLLVLSLQNFAKYSDTFPMKTSLQCSIPHKIQPVEHAFSENHTERFLWCELCASLKILPPILKVCALCKPPETPLNHLMTSELVWIRLIQILKCASDRLIKEKLKYFCSSSINFQILAISLQLFIASRLLFFPFPSLPSTCVLGVCGCGLCCRSECTVYTSLHEFLH